MGIPDSDDLLRCRESPCTWPWLRLHVCVPVRGGSVPRAGGHRLAGATDKVALLGWGLLAGSFGQNPVDAREQVLRALNRVLARPNLLDQLVTLSTEFVQMFVRPFDLVVH